MLNSHHIKIIQSLNKKKFRQKYNLFLIEGHKIIKEIEYSDIKIFEYFTTDKALSFIDKQKTHIINENELKKLSFLQQPKDALALCELPIPKQITSEAPELILDGIQDPGNLGTIIRLADWFGIEQIICSHDCADVFNPKSIQASMGSFFRVNLFYTDLTLFLKNNKLPVYATEMNEQSVYKTQFPDKFYLMMGNEGNGIRPENFRMATQKLSIPRFGKNQSTESLNVAMATGILLGEIFGRIGKNLTQ